MKKIIALTVLSLLLITARLFAQSGSSACFGTFYTDSFKVKNYPKNLIDIDSRVKKIDTIKKEGSGKMMFLSRKITLNAFQPLPFMGKYQEIGHYYIVEYCNKSWYVSKSILEPWDDPQEEYILGISFILGFIAMIIVLFLDIPRVKHLLPLAKIQALKEYKNDNFRLLIYIWTLVPVVAVIIRILLLDHKSFNIWLYLSLLFWTVLILLIGCMLKNAIVNSRIVKSL
jgi:hypothetical protein